MYLMLSVLFLSASIAASGEWWSTPRSEDEKNFYYVGVSEGSEGVSELQDKAFNKAMSELIREHFGMSIQINESAVEQLKQAQLNVVTKQSSAPLFIKGIGIVKTKEKDLGDDRTRIYVQIQADKQSIKTAISNQISAPGNDSLNTFGDSHDSKVDISIKTHPQGALIYFSHLDRRFTLQGQGDARFYLPRGRYQMVVSSPGFKTVTKEIEARSQGTEESIILEELIGEINLEVFPDDARILLQGTKISSGKHKLPVDKVHKFVVSHPDYFSKEFEFVLETPETLTKDIQLEPKPSTIQYEVYPSGAQIEIDGKKAFVHQGRIEIEPGNHNIIVSAHGYFPHEETLYIANNRIYPLKVIRLKVDDNTMSPIDRGLAYRFEFNPFTSYNKVGYGVLGVAFHAEYHFISIGGGFAATEYDDKDDQESSTNSKDAKKKKLSDNYALVRLITPKLGSFKFYGSGIIGQYKRRKTDSFGETAFREQVDYTGVGGGVRWYISPRWSMHIDYLKLNATEKDTQIKSKQDRVLAGFGYEF